MKRVLETRATQRLSIEAPEGEIYGYVVLWDNTYDIGNGVSERVSPGALRVSDVVLRNGHGGPVLGRTTSGTLKVVSDKEGLYVSSKLDLEDPDAVSLLRKVARRDVTGLSVGMYVSDEKWVEDVRVVTGGEMVEAAVVPFPANTSARVDLREKASGHRVSLVFLDYLLGTEFGLNHHQSGGVVDPGGVGRSLRELHRLPPYLRSEARGHLLMHLDEIRSVK